MKDPVVDNLIKTIAELTSDFETLKEYQTLYNQYLETSQNIYNIFRQQMRDVVSECIQNRNTLASILRELGIAHQTRRFDPTTAFEIRTDSKKLLERLEETGYRHETTKNDIKRIIKLISDEKKIENNKLVNKACRVIKGAMPDSVNKIYPVCFFVVSDLTLHRRRNDHTLAEIAVGVLFTGALVKTIIYCKRHEAEMLSELIDNLILHMSQLQQYSEDFGSFVSKVATDLVNYIDSAQKNVTYSFFAGVRVEKLTDKMIKEVRDLRAGFFQVELEARALSKNTLDFF